MYSFRVFILSFVFALFSVTPAQAQGGEQYMVYEVYAGGIHAVQATLDMDFTAKDRYSLVMGAGTRGLLGALAPWQGTFESHGWIAGEGDYRPELHKSTTTWRDEVEVKEYKYTKDRRFNGLLITDHERPTYKKTVEDELTQGTTDAFTAAMEIMHAVAQGQDCQGSSEVFDGKRRFKQVFVHQGYQDLEPSRYNIFGGKAAECTVEVKPVAGKWHEKPRGWMSIQEQGRERGMMPTVWMAQMSENGPAIPVKVRVKTEYGTLFMHLAEYKNGDQLLVAEKRVID